MTAARTILAAAVAAGLGTATPVVAQSWDMPTRSNERNYFTQNLAQFAEEIAKSTDGQLEIVLHPEDALVRQPEVRRAVQTGQVPIGEYLMSLHTNENPIFGVDSIPFLANDYDSASRLAEAARPAIEEALAAQNIRLLFIAPWPPQAIYTGDEIDSVADLEGVEFRAYNPITARLAELMGALPVTVQQAEVPQAFSTGIIQAMITSPATGVDTQAWDFVNHFYDTRAMIPWNVVVVNEQMFQALDPAVQEAVIEASEAAEERIWQRAPEVNDELIATLEEHGMQIHQPSETLEAELQEIGDTLVQEWLDSAGEEGRQIIEAYRGQG